ncbi:hypothetical protein MN0502_02490 [Arthrobacter sp. MN05-02]|nr:hypothetical protein MN0502_02490 [Arthrobacter sp. MN05-02]
MLVIKVHVEEVDGGFEVTCPDAPAVRHTIGSLWDACTVRHALAQQAGVPDDLVWLQISAQTGAVTVISDVHPLHWVAFHSVLHPAHQASHPSDLIFEHALTALRHEADHALKQNRLHAQVKFILSFSDGTKMALPRHGGYLLRDVVEENRESADLSTWVKNRLTGLPASEAHWDTPITGVQVGIFGPEAPPTRRYR